MKAALKKTILFQITAIVMLLSPTVGASGHTETITCIETTSYIGTGTYTDTSTDTYTTTSTYTAIDTEVSTGTEVMTLTDTQTVVGTGAGNFIIIETVTITDASTMTDVGSLTFVIRDLQLMGRNNNRSIDRRRDFRRNRRYYVCHNWCRRLHHI